MASRSDFKSGYAPSGAASVYFEASLTGPAVVFMHAVFDTRMWDPQFDEFASRFQVVRDDHRRFGKSKMPDGPYALRDDLLEVLRHRGIAKITLVGCTMAGATAIDFALERPEMISALVLLGSSVSGLNDPSPLPADLVKHSTEFLTAVRDSDVDRERDMDAKYWLDGSSSDASRIDAVYRNRARHLYRENFSLKRFAMQEEPRKPPTIGRLAEIKAPTLVVIGDNDSADLVKPANRLAAEIPNASKVPIKNAAHLPSLEHREMFNPIMSDFLNRIV